MLLTVADSAEEVEYMRRRMAKLHYFTYCATTDKLIDAVTEYHPHVLALKPSHITEKLKADISVLHEKFPALAILLLSDEKDHGIAVTKQSPANTPFHHLVFDAMYYAPPSPNATPLFSNNLIVHGLLFNIYRKEIRIFSWRIRTLSDNEVYLLRYLAEHFPRRIPAQELAKECFGFGKTVSEKTVSSRIASINKKTSAIVKNRPIVTCIRGEGYQIDF